jgi:hypothetical protein
MSCLPKKAVKISEQVLTIHHAVSDDVFSRGHDDSIINGEVAEGTEIGTDTDIDEVGFGYIEYINGIHAEPINRTLTPGASRSGLATPRTELETLRSGLATPRSETEFLRSGLATPRSGLVTPRSGRSTPLSHISKLFSGMVPFRTSTPVSEEDTQPLRTYTPEERHEFIIHALIDGGFMDSEDRSKPAYDHTKVVPLA